LEDNGLWESPDSSSSFDVLPLVYKIPGRMKPVVHMLSDDNIYEVDLEHPTNEDFASLGLRWTAMPSFAKHTMRIGGIVYQNAPFNGVYVSSEIAQLLMDRYNVGSDIADLFGYNPDTDPFWQQAAMLELERAIVHSFRSNGVAIIDPHAAGENFCKFVLGQREQGHDTSIDWRMIGGLAGPCSEAWDLEERPLEMAPSFRPSMNGLLFYNSLDHKRDYSASFTSFDSLMGSLRGDDPASPIVPIDIPRIIIAYGTQTGAAEAAARKLKRWLRLLNPTLMSLDDAKGLKEVRLKNTTHLLCICSTFAHGDPPANARKFFNTVIPKTTGILYSVLALGSTLFSDFCKAGVKLDKMLEEAGLSRLTKAITKADEANSGDVIVVQWLEMMKRLLLPPHVEQELERRISQKSGPVIETKFVWLNSLPVDDLSPEDSTKSLCIANSELTDSKRGRSVRKVTFEANGVAYKTGDHLIVQTMNSSARIARFLTCFKEQLEKHFTTMHKGATSNDVIDYMLDKPFDLVATENGATVTNEYIFKTPTTLLKVLAEDLDLTLTGSFATELVSLCTDACTKFQSSSKVADFQGKMKPYLEGKQPLDDLIAYYPTIPHFFEAFPFLTSNALVSLADVLTVLPRMQPRYYSITSSPMVSVDKIGITVGVLDAETSKGAKFDGVCSHFLASLRENIDAVSITVRPSNFRLPEIKSCPMIFVSAETGIGPFIGFLQELQIARNAGQTIGQLHFFYGCHNENDFLYDHVLRRYQSDGLITQVHVAMSQSTRRPKQSVQDVIKDMGPALGKLLQGTDTQYYVCGDAVMAHACYEAAIDCLRSAAGVSRVAAVLQLQAMQLAERWHADVWGITQNFEEAKKAVEESKKASAKVWLTKFSS
jgi:sulfite reductase alpha subunit-like flavoprotein